MRKKQQSDINPFHIFLGLLVGFLLGTTVVYWHSNRQNDRLYSETLDRVIAWFSDQNIHFEAMDSVMVVGEENNQMSTPGSSTSIFPSVSPTTPFRLAQDRLLHTKTIRIESTSAKATSAERRLDTLIGRPGQPRNGQIYFIEFWESPLNYVGYKMGKNKVILYGLRSYEMVSLAQYQGKIYLRYHNEYFPLEITNTYKPLIPSDDMFFTSDHTHVVN